MLAKIAMVLVLLAGLGSRASAQEVPRDFWAHIDQNFPYDYEARARRMTGAGVFRLRIDQKTGAVTEVAVMRSTGWKHLDQAAARTLVRWKARVPPSRQTVTVPVTFTANPPPPRRSN